MSFVGGREDTGTVITKTVCTFSYGYILPRSAGPPSSVCLGGCSFVEVLLARVVIIHVAGLSSVLALVLFDVLLAWSKSTALQEFFSLHSLHVSHSGAGHTHREGGSRC